MTIFPILLLLTQAFISGHAIEIDNEDKSRLPDLLPTVYHMANEFTFSCVGWYGRPKNRTYYNGSERTGIKDADGNIIATVCTRFYKELLMQGSGILKDRGEGKLTLNYDHKAGPGDYRFRLITNHCSRGEGVEHGLCLIPYHTIAADLSIYNVGDIIFIKRVKGIRLPDGSAHEGFFVVRDTGGAFEGVGNKRVDLFADDKKQTFLDHGFHKTRPEEAYKINGDSKTIVENWLKNKYPSLW